MSTSNLRPLVEVSGLQKSYGGRPALQGVDLRIEEGEAMVLLGPNGSGKTTLVRVLAGLTSPDGGSAMVAGADVRRHAVALRREVGFSGQFAAVDDYLTVREGIELAARLQRLDRRGARRRADELLELFSLGDLAARQARHLSGGQRRRVDLAMTVVARPRLLILDEPTAGLDPHARQELWRLIDGIVAAGTTLLLTTQQLEDIERVASRVAVLRAGRAIAVGSPAELRDRVGRDAVEVVASSLAGLERVLTTLESLTPTQPTVDRVACSLRIPAPDGRGTLLGAVRRLDLAGIDVEEIALRRPSLNEVFLALTGSPDGAGSGATAAGSPLEARL